MNKVCSTEAALALIEKQKQKFEGGENTFRRKKEIKRNVFFFLIFFQKIKREKKNQKNLQILEIKAYQSSGQTSNAKQTQK